MADANGGQIKCALIRGGTSRGAFLLQQDLPKQPQDRDRIVLSMFGNPDPSEVDGIGGNVPWMDIVSLVQKSARVGIDIEVTFGRVIKGAKSIDYSTICGDLIPAAVQFAVDRGIVDGASPVIKAQVLDTATGRRALCELPHLDGASASEDSCVVGAIPGAAPCVNVTFLEPGGVRGNLLPTGETRETVAVRFGEFEVSIVEATTPVVFVNAESLGLEGTELPWQMAADSDLIRRIEAIRAAAAFSLAEATATKTGSENEIGDSAGLVAPRLVTVFESMEYDDTTGRHISVMDTDLTCREFSLGIPHHAFDAEVAVCTAVAAHIPGTIVWDALLREDAPQVLNIGHPSGVISVRTEIVNRDGEPFVKSASIQTTVHRIMDGTVHLPHRNTAR